MNHNEQSEPLEDLLPDYLNGHASAEQRARVEHALQTDPEARILLEAEREVQRALAAPVAADSAVEPTHVVDAAFARFAQQINQDTSLNGVPRPIATRARRPLALAAAICIAAVALFTVSSGNDPESSLMHNGVQPNQGTGFATLSSAPVARAGSVLRVTAASDADLEDVLAEYELSVLERYPLALTADIALTGSTSAQLQSELAQDARVRIVKLLEPDPTNGH